MVEFSKSEHHYLRVAVRGAQLTVNATTTDGTIIDTLTLAPVPVIEAIGQIPAVSFDPDLVPGAIVRIVGRALASEEKYAGDVTPATDLAGTVVTLNDRPIELVYVSSNQLYGRLPFDVEGSITLRVTTGNGSDEISA